MRAHVDTMIVKDTDAKRKEIGDEIHLLEEKLRSFRPYTMEKARWWRPINTLDAGRIWSGECYCIKTWTNRNQAFWFFRDTYDFFKALPIYEGVSWVPDEEIERYRKDTWKEIQKKIAEFKALG